LYVDVLQAVKDARENFSLYDNLSEVDSVLCNLCKALANITL